MFRDKHVVVTGASSGIGRSFARQFAQAGARVSLVARRTEKLAALADELKTNASQTAVITADLVASGACERVLADARAAFGPIDVLVSNAGVGEYGLFPGQQLADLEHLVHLNVLAVLRLTHQVLPEMLERRTGHLINIASTAAFQPTPYMAVYGASKAFVLNFSMALWNELRKTGLRVTCVCPGPVRTGFFDRGGYHTRKVDWVRLGFDSDDFARVTMKYLKQGRSVCVPGLLNKLGAFSRHLAPLPLVTRISGKILGEW